MSQCNESKETLSKTKKERPLLSGEACAGAGRVCRFVLGRGQELYKERDRSQRPALSHFPQSRTTALLAASQDQRGCRATGPPPAPRLRLPGRLPLGTPPGAGPLTREPRPFDSHRGP